LWFYLHICHGGLVTAVCGRGWSRRIIWDESSTSLPNFRSRNGSRILRAAIIHYNGKFMNALARTTWSFWPSYDGAITWSTRSLTVVSLLCLEVTNILILKNLCRYRTMVSVSPEGFKLSSLQKFTSQNYVINDVLCRWAEWNWFLRPSLY
jgi:hypothetical protein